MKVKMIKLDGGEDPKGKGEGKQKSPKGQEDQKAKRLPIWKHLSVHILPGSEGKVLQLWRHRSHEAS